MLFDRISGVGGASASNLKRWAVRTTGRHQFEVSGQHATKASLVRSRLRVCPKCIVEDRQADGRLGVYRRHYWHFLSVRACAVHSVPLLLIPPEKYTIHNYDFVGQVERHWYLIKLTAERGAHRRSTDLEQYIFDRLNGVERNLFLDQMPLFIATRLCEVLGFVLLFGPARKISHGSDDELAKAGQAGFDAVRSGEDGLYAALDKLVSPMALRTVCHQSDLGALFEWVRSSSLGNSFEPLKNKIRDYIFRTYPFREGDMVLGQPCAMASKFTIHRAWQSLGIQRERMNRFLIAEGMAHKDATESEVQLNSGLTAKDIDRISQQIADRLNSREARDLLGVSSEVLQQLRDWAILAPHLDALDQVPKYDRQDVDNLIKRLSHQVLDGPPLESKPVTIIEAARRLRCPCAQIIRLMLDGGVTTVCRNESTPGLAGFMICLSELRGALPPIEMSGVTRGEAARLLRVAYPTINYLVVEGLLISKRVRNPRSRQFLDAICNDSIEAFQEKYVTLGALAKRYRRAPGPLGCQLEAKGICPLETPKGISWIFERRGLEARLRKSGIFRPDEASDDADTPKNTTNSARKRQG